MALVGVGVIVGVGVLVGVTGTSLDVGVIVGVTDGVGVTDDEGVGVGQRLFIVNVTLELMVKTALVSRSHR